MFVIWATCHQNMNYNTQCFLDHFPFYFFRHNNNVLQRYRPLSYSFRNLIDKIPPNFVALRRFMSFPLYVLLLEYTFRDFVNWTGIFP
jgi:hypothetical protein